MKLTAVKSVYGICLFAVGVLCVIMRGCYQDGVCAVLLTVSSMLTLYKAKNGGLKLPSRAGMLMLIALILYAVIGTIGSRFMYASLTAMFKLLFAADILLLLMSDRHGIKAFINGIWTGCLIVCIAGLAAYAGIIHIKGGVLTDNGVKRLQSIIQYANTTALFMAVGHIITVYNRIKHGRKLLYIVEVLFLTAMLLTFSKLLISIYVSVIIAAAILFKRREFLITAALIAAVAMLLILYGGVINEAAKSSFTSRWRYMQDAVCAIRRNVWVGIGSGMWRYRQFAYQSEFYDVSYIHNGILQVAVDAGAGVFAVFSAAVILYTVNMLKAIRKKRDDESIMLFMIFILILAHSLVDIDLSFGAVLAVFAACFAALPCDGDRKITAAASAAAVCVPVLIAVVFGADLNDPEPYINASKNTAGKQRAELLDRAYKYNPYDYRIVQGRYIAAYEEKDFKEMYFCSLEWERLQPLNPEAGFAAEFALECIGGDDSAGNKQGRTTYENQQ